MPNFIMLHKQSQLIQSVVTAPTTPKPSIDYSFHAASVEVLNKFYRLLTKARRNGILVSSGDLARVSPSFQCSLVETRE
jgi:hypothetical protein